MKFFIVLLLSAAIMSQMHCKKVDDDDDDGDENCSGDDCIKDDDSSNDVDDSNSKDEDTSDDGDDNKSKDEDEEEDGDISHEVHERVKRNAKRYRNTDGGHPKRKRAAKKRNVRVVNPKESLKNQKEAVKTIKLRKRTGGRKSGGRRAVKSTVKKARRKSKKGKKNKKTINQRIIEELARDIQMKNTSETMTEQAADVQSTTTNAASNANANDKQTTVATKTTAGPEEDDVEADTSNDMETTDASIIKSVPTVKLEAAAVPESAAESETTLKPKIIVVPSEAEPKQAPVKVQKVLTGNKAGSQSIVIHKSNKKQETKLHNRNGHGTKITIEEPSQLEDTAAQIEDNDENSESDEDFDNDDDDDAAVDDEDLDKNLSDDNDDDFDDDDDLDDEDTPSVDEDDDVTEAPMPLKNIVKKVLNIEKKQNTNSHLKKAVNAFIEDKKATHIAKQNIKADKKLTESLHSLKKVIENNDKAEKSASQAVTGVPDSANATMDSLDNELINSIHSLNKELDSEAKSRNSTTPAPAESKAPSSENAASQNVGQMSKVNPSSAAQPPVAVQLPAAAQPNPAAQQIAPGQSVAAVQPVESAVSVQHTAEEPMRSMNAMSSAKHTAPADLGADFLDADQQAVTSKATRDHSNAKSSTAEPHVGIDVDVNNGQQDLKRHWVVTPASHSKPTTTEASTDEEVVEALPGTEVKGVDGPSNTNISDNSMASKLVPGGGKDVDAPNVDFTINVKDEKDKVVHLEGHDLKMSHMSGDDENSPLNGLQINAKIDEDKTENEQPENIRKRRSVTYIRGRKVYM